MLANSKNQLPIYIQLMNQIRFKILSGVYEGGVKLPSIRSIAKDTGINPGTVQRSLVELDQQDLIYKKKTRRFVIEDKEFIKKVQISLLKEKTEKFILIMTTMGFTKDEIISMLETSLGGKNEKTT